MARFAPAIATLAFALVAVADAPAARAQSTAVDAATDAAASVASGDLAGAASEAADAIEGAAEAKLLIADMIGAQVKGPDGATLGTVENLVVVPGGTLVAAILAVQGTDGEHLPVPYRLVKVSGAADALGVSVPVGLEELRANEAVAALASALDL